VEQKILSDIRKENRNGDQEEPITKTARELQHSANGTVHSSEWSNIDRLLRFRGKIYIPQSPDLCRQIVRATGHKALGESSKIRIRLLEGSFTLYTSLSVRVSRIGAKLVCLSITSKTG